MKTNDKRTVVLGLGAFALFGVVQLRAHAQEPAASASAQAPAAPLRPLAERALPAEASPAPSADDWQNAERVALLGDLPETCQARLLREWLQIRCEVSAGSFAVVSGSSEGVTAALVPLGARRRADGADMVTGSGTIQLPLRRGDRRIVQLSATDFSEYNGGSWARPFLIISEQWLDDQPAPWVAVTLDPD